MQRQPPREGETLCQGYADADAGETPGADADGQGGEIDRAYSRFGQAFIDEGMRILTARPLRADAGSGHAGSVP
jgi:hypothetical protein